MNVKSQVKNQLSSPKKEITSEQFVQTQESLNSKELSNDHSKMNQLAQTRQTAKVNLNEL